MARAISDEEQQLKRRARRRLIGAIVLVTAVVVVLPMVLDSEPKPAGEPVAIRIPSPDSGEFQPKIPPPAAPADKKPTESAPTAAAPAPEPAPASGAAAPASGSDATEPGKRADPKPAAQAPMTAAKPKNGQYVVQVIALADAGRARQLQEKISAAGIRSYTEVVKTQKGGVTRVRAGPFPSRRAAEKARDQLKTLGMNGNVTAR